MSRGAQEAVFVENSRQALACIRDNLERTHLAGKAKILQTDVSAAISRLAGKGAFDIIFMDPPYDGDFELPVLRQLAASSLVGEDTLIIAETRMEKQLTDAEAFGLTVVREKQYKNNKHIFLRRKEQSE